MTIDIDVNSEPLPGYRLIEHIGSGGYGEVWRAEAPGGLTKAIKFVFGQHHEKRASNELRALDRVRSVRHPFLLSLERIEVVDGRLLVVTELADGSVKDLFDACRRQGLSGIPRQELLGYLRDAADALDFMRETHTLQHLDIKPENLLILAGHVKVADFGLVKDVKQSQASLVGGMTPLYAAPEVFRGTPSGHSDQYSLAIVYQEMLTGTLPFGGGNVAELTLQHLNDEPDLAALTTADRYAVSRALAKDSQHRYSSCRDFIDALVKSQESKTSFEPATQTATSFSISPEGHDGASQQNLATDFFDDESCWEAAPKQLLIELPAPDQRIVDLPPLAQPSANDSKLAPTLVLGIGGTAGRVLAHFRRLIHDQYGAGSNLPAVQFLLLDTDSRALAETVREESGLTTDETLNLALRRPQHYREHSQQLLTWLSRRWLYNIPRSLRTEGLRPLGRLALTDHARQTGQRIRRAISQAVDPESLAKTSHATQQPFQSDGVRVFVVASISGGTGGGMSLDVAYMVRAVLEKLGIAQAGIIGLMMHSTGGEPRHTELARVNAYSWLSEFQHFQRAENAYPGDGSCGLPPHAAGVPPFDNTYLLHLGENLDAMEFDHAAQSVAEYLRLNILSTAHSYFESCREERVVPQPERCTGGGSLRSFGIYRRTAAPPEVSEMLATFVSQQVLAGWRLVEEKPDSSWPFAAVSNSPTRPPGANSEAPVATSPTQLISRLQLDSSGIAANARSLVELQLGGDATNFLSAWFAKQSSTRGAGEHLQLQAIDRIFGAGSGVTEDRKIFLLGQPVAAIVQPLDEKLRSEIRRWVNHHLDDPRERLSGARRALVWINEHLRECDNDLQRLRRTVVAKLTEIRDKAIAAVNPAEQGDFYAAHSISQRVHDYFRLRLDQLAITAAEHTVQLILSDAKGMTDEITALSREIEQIATAVTRTIQNVPLQREMEVAENLEMAAQARLAASLQPKLPALAAEVDRQLQADFINQQGGLLRVIMHGGRPRAQLGAKLYELSRQAVQYMLAGVNVLDDDAGNGKAKRVADLHSGLVAATPALLEFGGTRRVLAVLPRDSNTDVEVAMLSRAIGSHVAAVPGADNSLTLCVEADKLSLPHIAVNFVQCRRDRVDFALRVHCRTDIPWMPLVETSELLPSETWNESPSYVSRHTQSRQDLCKTLVM